MSNFNKLVKNRCEKIHSVLASKAKEYAVDNNRFHNFDLAAAVNNTTPEKALWGMATKHLVSVIDIVNSPETVSLELIEEKIGDMINYLILLEGLLKRRQKIALKKETFSDLIPTLGEITAYRQSTPPGKD